VFCQLDALQHCFPPNLRQYLNEMPDTLDETYERILKGINKAQRDNAHRLLQCLTVAARPLRVEELAELLAFDFQASTKGGIPTLKEDWRWDDEEEAVLSTCSSLITIIPRDDSRVVQFSHFSVKEFLTSSRLAQSPLGDVSRFCIDLESAHTIMAQACLATLLRLGQHDGNSNAKASPLVNYAAQHWVDHAQFENVSSRVRDGMDDLFDSSKPYFAAWLQTYDIDEYWGYFSPRSGYGIGSPLYYAAFCGFYDLAERLIMKHPEQVNARGGRHRSPASGSSVQGTLPCRKSTLHTWRSRGCSRRWRVHSTLHSIMFWTGRYHALATRSRRRPANAVGYSGFTPLHRQQTECTLRLSRSYSNTTQTSTSVKWWRDSVVLGLVTLQPGKKARGHGAATIGAWGRPKYL
jgi:hypothetical protein